MRARNLTAIGAAVVALTGGAFVAGGYMYGPSGSTDAAMQAASNGEQYANNAEQSSGQNSAEQETDGDVRNASNTDGEETVGTLDFSTCEGGMGYRVSYEDISGNEKSGAEALSPGDSAVFEDCGRGIEQRVSGVRAYWTEGYESTPEYMNVEFSITNEGEGMLDYERDQYALMDNMGTAIDTGKLGADYILEEPSNLLAPGETATWTIETEITPDTIGMPLILRVEPQIAPAHSTAYYEFEVPEIPGYMRPVSPEHPANGTGATTVEEAG